MDGELRKQKCHPRQKTRQEMQTPHSSKLLFREKSTDRMSASDQDRVVQTFT